MVTVAKLVEALPLVLAMLLVTALSGGGWASAYLQRGQLAASLLWGGLIGVLMFVPFVTMGGLQAVMGAGTRDVRPILLGRLPGSAGVGARVCRRRG